MAPASDVIDRTASRLGISSLRTAQRQAIDAVLGGSDALVVLPTGGGKSAIYQIATEATDGATVIVSPLLALQADQRRSIESAALSDAASIDGSTTDEERAEVLRRLADGRLRYLFATPEVLTGDDLVDELSEHRIDLLVVDEAHCIVTWGHGFRPDFLLLGDVRARLGSPTTLALTGSADPRIRTDVVRSLGLDGPTLTSDLDRPNIHVSVVRPADRDTSVEMVVDHVAQLDGKALVYVATRKSTEELTERLIAAGRRCLPYHGGLPTSQKDAAAELILHEPDAVVVATTAFGMGIDISDISHVVHLDMPETLLAYYQEIGRAGRDGDPATATVFVAHRHRSRRAFAAGVRSTTPADCVAVHRSIHGGATSRRAVAESTSLPLGRIVRALAVLAEIGAVSTRPTLRSLAEVDVEEVERGCAEREEFDRSQQMAVERFRTSDRCRWAQILTTFGEVCDACGHCDVCEAAPSTTSCDRLPAGARIVHDAFGHGLVTARHDDIVSVAFDSVGPKELSASLLIDDGLVTLLDPIPVPERTSP